MNGTPRLEMEAAENSAEIDVDSHVIAAQRFAFRFLMSPKCH
jgi:hypothetical protein